MTRREPRKRANEGQGLTEYTKNGEVKARLHCEERDGRACVDRSLLTSLPMAWEGDSTAHEELRKKDEAEETTTTRSSQVLDFFKKTTPTTTIPTTPATTIPSHRKRLPDGSLESLEDHAKNDHQQDASVCKDCEAIHGEKISCMGISTTSGNAGSAGILHAPTANGSRPAPHVTRKYVAIARRSITTPAAAAGLGETGRKRFVGRKPKKLMP